MSRQRHAGRICFSTLILLVVIGLLAAGVGLALKLLSPKLKEVVIYRDPTPEQIQKAAFALLMKQKASIGGTARLSPPKRGPTIDSTGSIGGSITNHIDLPPQVGPATGLQDQQGDILVCPLPVGQDILVPGSGTIATTIVDARTGKVLGTQTTDAAGVFTVRADAPDQLSVMVDLEGTVTVVGDVKPRPPPFTLEIGAMGGIGSSGKLDGYFYAQGEFLTKRDHTQIVARIEASPFSGEGTLGVGIQFSF